MRFRKGNVQVDAVLENLSLSLSWNLDAGRAANRYDAARVLACGCC